MGAAAPALARLVARSARRRGSSRTMTGVTKQLIVNGDDFGQTPGTTEGILWAHARGVLTSASLLVRWPAARLAAGCALADPTLDVGLHVDFGEWTYSN